jgi:N-acetylhexosamine 1-kinase
MPLLYTASMTHHPGSSPENAAQLEQARTIAPLFSLRGRLGVCDFTDKGNINQQTYLVSAETPGGYTEYLLQQLNPGVFTRPHAVMGGMIACIQAQQKAMAEGILSGEEWETIQLIPTKEGKDYLEIPGETGNECWRMMVRIRDAFTYRSLREIADPDLRIRVAEEAGRGLAFFGNLTAGMDISKIGIPLPGYRQTENYYNQLLAILAGCRSLEQAEPFLPRDAFVRQGTETLFLIQADDSEYRRRLKDPQSRRHMDFVLEQQSFALTLIRKLESGELDRVVVHGDTKLDNFLFSTQSGRVKALVDLDTIMPHTWLSDWGDMVRSFVNIAGEREQDLERIDVDLRIFGALAKGFLCSARRAKPLEIGLMVDAAQIMALELGVRFLADYLRGDNYFQLKPGDPQDLNKIRAMVQFRLFERIRDKADALGQIVQSCSR